MSEWTIRTSQSDEHYRRVQGVTEGLTTIDVNVWPCDEVCDRTSDEQRECCRAHGHLNGSCYGGRMVCKREIAINSDESIDGTITGVNFWPCDEVCDRILEEQTACCRAHGYSMGFCTGGKIFCQ